MKIHPFLALVALGLAFLASGCGTRVRPDSVNVSVASLKTAASANGETRLTVTLRFTSESLNPFGFAGSTHKLYLDGTYAGRINNETPIGLPPMSTLTHDVTLVPENGAQVKQILTRGGSVNYRLDTVLLTKSGDEEMRIKTDFSGTVDVR